ncbi:hypothetical protein M758_5G081900 [Ceratodon purpureus]|nr:hypothetical protein M758_5G081900 [Ceratodon purpureus]
MVCLFLSFGREEGVMGRTSSNLAVCSRVWGVDLEQRDVYSNLVVVTLGAWRFEML